MAERVGFVPAVPSLINDLGLIRSPQITKSTQSLSIRYKTGTAKSIRRRLAKPTLYPQGAPGEGGPYGDIVGALSEDCPRRRTDAIWALLFTHTAEQS
jgi:hypothetical protein